MFRAPLPAIGLTTAILGFGLVSGHEDELGYFSLNELENLKGPFGLKVERDLYFQPTDLKSIQKKG